MKEMPALDIRVISTLRVKVDSSDGLCEGRLDTGMYSVYIVYIVCMYYIIVYCVLY